MPALLDTFDDDGVVAGHDAHLAASAVQNPFIIRGRLFAVRGPALRSFCRCA
jgi:hypothetical protein